MANEIRTYRHSVTGIVAAYPVSVARAHKYLVEVPEGSKPLAYTPIPQAAIENLRRERAQAGTAGDADSPDIEDSEQGDPATDSAEKE